MRLPAADDGYTPEQRRIVDAALAEGLADIEAGRVHGPFSSHEEFIASLHIKTIRETP
jgi:predicted transcriptional regulator